MNLSSKVRLYWNLTEHYDIDSADDSDNTFTIADADLTAYFYAGRPFVVVGTGAGNDGEYEVISSALVSGDTVITVEAVAADQGSDGRIGLTGLYPIISAEEDDEFSFEEKQKEKEREIREERRERGGLWRYTEDDFVCLFFALLLKRNNKKPTAKNQ